MFQMNKLFLLVISLCFIAFVKAQDNLPIYCSEYSNSKENLCLSDCTCKWCN